MNTLVYNQMPEAVSLLIAIFVLAMMVYTLPKKSFIYFIDYAGIILSIFAIFFYGHMIRIVKYPRFYTETSFRVGAILFYVSYLILLHFIYSYVNLLSYKRRTHIPQMLIMESLFSIVYLVVMGYIVFWGKMVEQNGNELILTPQFYVYIYFGIATSIFTFFAYLTNRKELSHIVHVGIIVFVPIDLILLFGQLLIKNIVFISLTYVLPFLVFYVLFHSNPYDEILGCQNDHSFETIITQSISRKQNFTVIFVRLPRLKNIEFHKLDKQFEKIAVSLCRKIDNVHKEGRIYSISNFSYALYLPALTEENALRISKEITDILNHTPSSFLSNEVALFKAVTLHNPPTKSVTQFESLIRFLLNKTDNTNRNENYFATNKDYIEFEEFYRIEQLLLDIRNSRNLNDERVICYTQPIYSVQSNTFRTAEALMRLSLDGKVIYPDKFIPLAERNGCIHTLTCIILNKVCQKIAELDPHYEIDAITINCSTTEMSDRNQCKELLDIILQNQIPCSKIRLELTESAMFNDYDTLQYNMKTLTDAGIAFYLDDFGTGYSNLERIISCPFMTIKFDKSLLYKSLSDSILEELVVNMVNIFKKSGFVVLIEGVEDNKQSQYSIERGFEYIQGYHYAKPIPIDQLADYLNPSNIN